MKTEIEVCKYTGCPLHSCCKLLRRLFSDSPVILLLMFLFLVSLLAHVSSTEQFHNHSSPFPAYFLAHFPFFLPFPLLSISLPLSKFLPCEPQLLPAACCQKYVKAVRTRTAQIVNSGSWHASELGEKEKKFKYVR